MELLLAHLARGAVVLALAFGAERCLRRCSASLRHAVWVTAFAALLALPLVALLAPRIEVPLALEPELVPRAARAPETIATGTGISERAPSPVSGDLAVPEWLLITWLLGAAFLAGLHVLRLVAPFEVRRLARGERPSAYARHLLAVTSRSPPRARPGRRAG